eukprot:NODE_108_length_19701_cov_0.369452.p5 type:complete len:333 gc:universal NODE_108_length_19701_cov_0.369452:4143-5141(+)
MPRHKSEDFKEACVRHYRNISHSRDETCRVLGCSSRSLARWIERYDEDGSIERHNRQARAYKFKESHQREALDYLSKHQTASSPELHAHLVTTFEDYNITSEQLHSIIRDNNLTRKRTKHGRYPSVRRRQETDRKADLRAFYAKTTSHDINKIVSIDEASLTPFMYRPYSRCPIGDKCIERTGNNKVFTKHTFVAAITSSRIVGWKLYDEGAMNAERFVEFVKSIIERHNLRGYLFLFDNAGAHKGQGIRELIEQTGNTFSYTIPYNSQTNAIEAWFSQFKHYMESSRTRDIDATTVSRIPSTGLYVRSDMCFRDCLPALKGRKAYKDTAHL